ncbi:hypothetical protein HKX48_003053 [Thoreauomyces humboldtii]|nr:hypothetical protein HKX48_003053 [Thoreauomyces humboldtii]
MDSASQRGLIDLLDHWKARNGTYTHVAFDWAASPDVMEWWIASGLPIVYTDCGIDNCLKEDRIPVLDWWATRGKELGLEIKYTHHAIDLCRDVKVLDWWAANGTTMGGFSHTDRAMNECQGDEIHVLDWWVSNRDRVELKFCQFIASHPLDDEVAEWWKASGLVSWNISDDDRCTFRRFWEMEETRETSPDTTVSPILDPTSDR